MRCVRKECIREAISSSNYCDEHQLFPDIIMKYAGSLSLDDLARTLAVEEKTRLMAMVSFEKAGDHNLVYFERQDSHDLTPIILIQVNLGESADTLKAQQLAVGKEFIFQGYLLVNNEKIQVLAFR
jgi:hypothetical protein